MYNICQTNLPGLGAK